MKKLTMICMSALLMLAVSCKKDKKTEVENADSGFRATVESHEGTGKTHLEDLAVKWDSDDAILVKSNSCPDPRGFTTQESGATVNFDADATLPTDFYAPPYTGYYPAGKFSGNQLTLPATQTYVAGSFGNGANPMAATSSDNVLPFKNICGVLKLQLYSATACQVRSISITSNTGEMLCGTGAVGFDAADDNDNPTLGTLTGGGNSLTLDMGEGGKPMSIIEGQPTNYFFVVPAGTLGESFTVKVTDGNGNVWTKTANAPANRIVRSQITELPTTKVDEMHEPVVPVVTTTVDCVDCTYTFSGNVTVSGTQLCEYGFVYAKTADNADPTIGGTGCVKFTVNTEPLSSSKDFTADLLAMGLEQDVEYTVKAYGICEAEAYGTKQTYVYSLPKSLPSSWTNGKNPHPFTVASGKQVYFSQGNLQYIGSAATPYWKFADHQFDFLGNNGQGNTSETADRDLFGWGTSGYNHGATCYQPWSTSETNSNYYAYGAYDNNLEGGTSPHTGMADWGKANTIYAGTAPTTGWRTLTNDEWVYLISTRKDSNGNLLYGESKVGNCTPGLIILPDDWSCPAGVTDVVRGTSSWSNVYTYSEWAKMEAAGAVFLPAAGDRFGTSVDNVGSYGYYWSSSYFDSYYTYYLLFSSGDVLPTYYYRYSGFSVRLVSDYKVGGSANDFGSGTW